ncbi:probable G-protein coupled receptor Mth-like 3 [Schistocerca piceifrons]|uniref:probable G-protein coupled receptor Mth-like 3 n=1 Tax=Schistocerca piceifrons TaxID=274613 RepID=UPI001F5EA2ED|nr:probable G-protein coupled receptor Mth-like 3 [Schistocerca piceifrons]
MLCPWQRLLPLVLAVWASVSSGDLLVRKCCGQHQFMDDKHVCRDANASQDNSDDPWWWLPKSSVSLNNTFVEPENVARVLSGVRAEYNATATCDQESQLELVNLPGEDMDEFHLHIGSQQVELQVLVLDTAPEGALVPATSFCVDGVRVGSRVLHVAFACVCAGAAPCVRKCCKDYQAYDPDGDGRCVQVSDEEWDRDPDIGFWRPTLQDRTATPKHFVVRARKPRCSLRTYSTQGNASGFVLRDDGHLLVPTGAWLAPEEFCAERVLFRDSWLVVFACLQPAAASSALHVVEGVLLSLLLLPARLRRRLHVRLSLAHNATLAAAFVATAVLHLSPDAGSPTGCVLLAFVIQFTFLAAFFWLNVMCIDISWTFTGMRTTRCPALERDRRRFLWYSAYAWGCTAAICAAAVGAEFSPAVPEDSPFKPNINKGTCWFKGKPATLVYFYGPMALLLVSNLCLFAYTAGRICVARRGSGILRKPGSQRHHGGSKRRQQQEQQKELGPEQARREQRKDRERLALYGKLFGLMGVTWLMEIVSWAVGGPAYVWIVTDLVNVMRPAFIFYIFCCNRTVVRQLRTKLPGSWPCALAPSQGGDSVRSGGGSSSGAHSRPTGTASTSANALEMASLRS